NPPSTASTELYTTGARPSAEGTSLPVCACGGRIGECRRMTTLPLPIWLLGVYSPRRRLSSPTLANR
ncbi:unnamed protein product, partial [Ectocarpus sp. 8 AP-2014]